MMSPYREKLLRHYHTVKNSNKLLSLAVLLALAVTIPTTVSLSQKVVNIRQYADSYTATITVNPTTAKTGDTLTVGWTIGKTTGGTTSPTPPSAPTPYQTFTEGKYIAAEPNPCVLNADGKCKVTISWGINDLRGIDRNNIRVIAREANVVIDGGQYGSRYIDWITTQGVTFDLYVENKVVASVFVKGDTYPISHTPPPFVSNAKECTFEAQRQCFQWGYAGGCWFEKDNVYYCKNGSQQNTCNEEHTTKYCKGATNGCKYPTPYGTDCLYSAGQTCTQGEIDTASKNGLICFVSPHIVEGYYIAADLYPDNKTTCYSVDAERCVYRGFSTCSINPQTHSPECSNPLRTPSCTPHDTDYCNAYNQVCTLDDKGQRRCKKPASAMLPTQKNPIAASFVPSVIRKVHAQGSTNTTTNTTITGAETLQLINTANAAVIGPKIYLNCLPATPENTPPANALLTGSCTYPLASILPPGSYVIRMWTADGTAVIGNSTPFTIHAGANIVASPNPCVLNEQGTCTSTITWTGQGSPDVEIRIKENPEALFAKAPNGSQAAPWITALGATFELYSGNTLLTSVLVKGVPANKLVASPNPCAVDAKGLCISTIAWNAQGKENVSVKVNGVLFAQGVAAISLAPWITTQGATFELYSGDTPLDTLKVEGVLPTDPRAPTPTPSPRPRPTAPPTPIPTIAPTAIPTRANAIPTQVIIPTSTPTPAPVYPTDNPAYHYHYNSND